MYGKIFNEFRPYSIYYYLFNIDKTSGLKVITKIALIKLLRYFLLLIKSNNNKIKTITNCLLFMNAVWLVNLFIIKKEIPAAGFKSSNSL